MRSILVVAVLMASSAVAALAQGTYTQIDEPNAVGATYCFGIDAAGDIVGSYTYASGVAHGFLLSGGTTYTTIDYPGSQNTGLYGINNAGQIVGFATYPSPVVGFLYDIAAQAFTTIDYPHTEATYPYSINDKGTVAGYFTHGAGAVSGFELIGATYKQVIPPNALNSYVFGITAGGALAGYVPTLQTKINFLDKQGKYYPITIPNASQARITGINPMGTALVGVYNPTSTSTEGFLFQNKTTQELQFPGGVNDTLPYGVNNAGEVVGWFLDAVGDAHGFTWTPAAAAEKK